MKEIKVVKIVGNWYRIDVNGETVATMINGHSKALKEAKKLKLEK